MTTALPPMLAFIRFPGGWEWIVILLIVLLLFSKRLPDLGRSVGKGIVEFKKGLKGAKASTPAIDASDEPAGKPLQADAAGRSGERPVAERRDTTSA